MRINNIKKFQFKVFMFKCSIILNQWKEFTIKRVLYRIHQEKFFIKKIRDIKLKNMFNNWKNSIECSLCMTRISSKNVIKTDCGHNFCNTCINTWKNYCFNRGNHATCPTCRNVFEYKPYGEYFTPRNIITEQLIIINPPYINI
mgnify:CR=1 FL=1